MEGRIPAKRVLIQVSRCVLTALCTVLTLTLLGFTFPSEGQDLSRSADQYKGHTGAPRYKSYKALAQALPKDAIGNLDWDAAVRDGLLYPLPTIEPGVPGKPPLPLDVLLDPHVTGLEVVFSHETHTYWLSCDSCHPSISVMQAGVNPITMEKIYQGEYCGRCHGSVAFAVESNCSRCHERIPAKAARPATMVTGEVPGDIVMNRHSNANYQAAVVFRHWTHRMHFRCSACHSDVFKMRAGANKITMNTLLAGESCGICHDGLRAFGVDLETCSACHSHEGP